MKAQMSLGVKCCAVRRDRRWRATRFRSRTEPRATGLGPVPEVRVEVLPGLDERRRGDDSAGRGRGGSVGVAVNGIWVANGPGKLPRSWALLTRPVAVVGSSRRRSMYRGTL
jgi:hypothetical protein